MFVFLKLIRVFCCAFALLIADATGLFAEQGEVLPVRNAPRVYPENRSDFSPPLGTYTYTAGWQGIPAATCTISIDREGDYFRVVASARTYSGIDLFYKLRYRAEGIIAATSFAPVRSIFDQRENSRIKNTILTFRENGEVQSVRATRGQPPVLERVISDGALLDPFSAAFIARGWIGVWGEPEL